MVGRHCPCERTCSPVCCFPRDLPHGTAGPGACPLPACSDALSPWAAEAQFQGSLVAGSWFSTKTEGNLFLIVEAGERSVPGVRNIHVCASTHTHVHRHRCAHMHITDVCTNMFITHGHMHVCTHVCLHVCTVWHACMRTRVPAYCVCVFVLLTTLCVMCTRGGPHARRSGVGGRCGAGVAVGALALEPLCVLRAARPSPPCSSPALRFASASPHPSTDVGCLPPLC